MMIIDRDLCVGCKTCEKDCPLGIIKMTDKKAVIGQGCCECKTCLKVCPAGAVRLEEKPLPAGHLLCPACPVACQVPPGKTGACRRFVNQGGQLARTQPLLTYEDVKDSLPAPPAREIATPLITALGAGGTYPDYVPAPHIVSSWRDGVEVVTAVTEAPLSYSGVKVKIDTDAHIGEEGAEIKFEGRAVGMVETEEYGSKMLAIGGVTRLTGKNGMAAARAVAAIANRQAIDLRVKGGSKLSIRVGEAPVIDGEKMGKMRVGCGSATAGLFAPFFQKAADEVVVLDAHITSLFTHHAAGRCLGALPSGLDLSYRLSTPGRYFGQHGHGINGTSIVDPLDIVKSVDCAKCAPGFRLLITETTGKMTQLFELDGDGKFQPVPLTPEAAEVASAIQETCQDSRVSAFYAAGAGGSARAGVAKYPLRLSKAVHEGRAVLTVGGAPVFLLPGGGISFYVDVEKVRVGGFTWVPTPATVCPIEYTMKLDDFKAMGGHLEAMKPFTPRDPLVWKR